MYSVFGIVANAVSILLPIYIVFISILVFYICKFWEPVEDKYFSLKLLIYEECRDRESKQTSPAAGAEENISCAYMTCEQVVPCWGKWS
jgi:hypothetical protein